MQYIFLRVLMRRIKAIPPFLRDKTVPFRKKLLVILGILYFLWPFDIIPTPILLFGIIDDLVIWGSIIYYLRNELDKYWLGDNEIAPEKSFHGITIINDVKFDVKDNGADERETQ